MYFVTGLLVLKWLCRDLKTLSVGCEQANSHLSGPEYGNQSTCQQHWAEEKGGTGWRKDAERETRAWGNRSNFLVPICCFSLRLANIQLQTRTKETARNGSWMLVCYAKGGRSHSRAGTATDIKWIIDNIDCSFQSFKPAFSPTFPFDYFSKNSNINYNSMARTSINLKYLVLSI